MGSTVRYLAALSIPMALLAAIGALELFRLLASIENRSMHGLLDWLASHPKTSVVIALSALSLVTSRPFFDPGFVPEMRRHMGLLPDATKIFTHRAMRDVAYLAASQDAARFEWVAPKSIIEANPVLEAEAAGASEFWYLRKQLWMRERKGLERSAPAIQPALASYIETPERDWILTEVLEKGSDSDLVFYRRRNAGLPPPVVLTERSPEFRELIPPLPLAWDYHVDDKSLSATWRVPVGMRDKLVALELGATSATVEPFIAKVQFMVRGRKTDLLLKPILYAGGGKDFFALHVPADAESCGIELRFSQKTQSVRFTTFRAIYDEAR